MLSEDVDTLMFGCTMHLRNWSSEGAKGNKAPTHVDVYQAEEIKKGKAGLDREGMVLVALMSGGDYIPAGIPGCGPKVACEAARARFGHDLFKIDRKDTVALRQWRERLEYELMTNESGYFRTRHKLLKIPENFPDKAVLYYYMHPVVSNEQQVARYSNQLKWGHVDVADLRRFSVRAFEWRGYTGLRHFIRVMAPSLVGQRLAGGLGACSAFDDMDTQAEEEEKLIKAILGKRTHLTTDNIPELRIAYVPKEIVGLDMEAELRADQDLPQTHTAIYSSDEEMEEAASDGESAAGPTEGPRKRRNPSRYDPAKPEKDWFPETYVRLGVPLTVENWEAEMRDPKKFASRKARARSKLKSGMPRGAIEPFLRVRKPGYQNRASSLFEGGAIEKPTNKPAMSASQPILPVQRSGTVPGRPRKRGVKKTKTSTQDISNLPASGTAADTLECSQEFRKLPSSMPAGQRSFRAPAIDESRQTKQTKKRSRARKEQFVQEGTVVILSSPTKPEIFPFESSQRHFDEARSDRTVENLDYRGAGRRINHKNTAPESPESCTSSLPSPNGLFHSTLRCGDLRISSIGAKTVVKAARQKAEHKVVLRESLEGSWRAVDDYEAEYLTPKRCFPGVEVVDLTAS